MFTSKESFNNNSRTTVPWSDGVKGFPPQMLHHGDNIRCAGCVCVYARVLFVLIRLLVQFVLSGLGI